MLGNMRCDTSSQPSRSRCGQSVSTLCRLASTASTVMLWMRFTHSLLLVQVPTRRAAARTKLPLAAATLGSVGAGGGGPQVMFARPLSASAGRYSERLGAPGASAVQRHTTEKSFAQFWAGSGRHGGAPAGHVLSPQTHTQKGHTARPLQKAATAAVASPARPELHETPYEA